MKVTFSPLPSLLDGTLRKAEIEVSPSEKIVHALNRARFLLALWLGPVGGLTKNWIVFKGEGVRVDIERFSAEDLHLEDGGVLYVALEDRVPENPLDEVNTSGSGIYVPNVLEGEDPGRPALPSDVLTETDILYHQQQVVQAKNRVRDIRETSGVKVSFQKILHDEVVDDYDEEHNADDDTYYYYEDDDEDAEHGYDAPYDAEHGFAVHMAGGDNLDRDPFNCQIGTLGAVPPVECLPSFNNNEFSHSSHQGADPPP